MSPCSENSARHTRPARGPHHRSAIMRSPSTSQSSVAERLERGEVVHYPVAPFPLPTGEALALLLEQRLASRAHKNIGYDPRSGKVTGYLRQGDDQADQLRHILAGFSRI